MYKRQKAFDNLQLIVSSKQLDLTLGCSRIYFNKTETASK